MSQLNFDARTVAPQQEFKPLAAGWYNVQIIKSELKPTKDHATTGHKLLELNLQVLDGPFKNRQLFWRLNAIHSNPTTAEIAKGHISAVCHAVGRLVIQDTAELHGIPFQAKIKIRPGSGGYEDSNDVSAVKAYEGPAGTSVPSAPPVASAGFGPPATAPVGGFSGSVPPTAGPSFAGGGFGGQQPAAPAPTAPAAAPAPAVTAAPVAPTTEAVSMPTAAPTPAAEGDPAAVPSWAQAVK
jgi:hypothetical protein